MQDNLKDRSKLIPVRTAPFFALGILLCANGGLFALVSIVLMMIITLILWRHRRGLVLSAASVVVGMIVITAYTAFVYQPLIAEDGSTHDLTCSITTRYDYGSQARYFADTVVSGRITSISFYYDDSLFEGDVLSGSFTLKSIADERTAARKLALSATINGITDVTTPKFNPARSMADFRRSVSEQVAEIGDEEIAGLAQGLLFGDTTGFSAELRHASKISGVMHFTAVSGSHFVIIMSVLLAFIPNKKYLRSLVSIILIPLAVLFFGGEATVVRAGIMLMLGSIGPLFNRRSDTINSLCVSVVAMTIFTPYVMLETGFQMSVLGVFGVTVLAPYISEMVELFLWRLPTLILWLVSLMVPSACAVICIAPVSVSAFGGISLTGVFATLVLTPIFTAALAVGVIFAVTNLPALIVALGLLLKAAYGVIMFFGADEHMWLVLDFPGAGLIATFFAVALIMLAVTPKSVKFSSITFAVCIAASFASSYLVTGSQSKITFVSDGSSGAAVVCRGNTAEILICGSGEGLEQRLSDCLLSNGIYEVTNISAPDITAIGIDSLEKLNELYKLPEVEAGAEYRSDSLTVNSGAKPIIYADELAITTAKAGDTEVSADIVIYHGYKMSTPQTGNVTVPVYVSSRQNLLPTNGVNVYDTRFVINLKS